MGNYFEADLAFVKVTVDGHNPPKSNRANHGSYADVEPLSGKILNERTQLQMNVWLSPRSCNGTMFPDEVQLPTTWWPCVTVDETSAAPKSTFDDIAGLVAYLGIAIYPGLVAFILGILGTVICIAYATSFLRATETEDGVRVHPKPQDQEEPQNASGAQRCWKQIQLVSPFRYSFTVLGFSLDVGILISAFIVPLANEFMFPVARRFPRETGGYMYVFLAIVPFFSGMSFYPHFLLRACVAESADATYWKRISLGQTVFFIVVVFVIQAVAVARGAASLNLPTAAGNVIMFAIHLPLTFYCISRALKRSMLRCWIAVSLEWLNLLVVYYWSSYRSSPAFQWTAPFIFVATSMFNKYTAKQTDGIPPEAAARMQFYSIAFTAFFTRLSQSFVFGNFGLTIGLELYYAALALFWQVTLYQRFAVISVLAEQGIVNVRAPLSERGAHISSMATIFESVYESAVFMSFFLLRFITNPPPNMSGIEATLLFFICKAIQVLGNALAAFVTYKYEGILLVERATVKNLKSEVCFWLVTLLIPYLGFLRIAGNAWDPNIKQNF